MTEVGMRVEGARQLRRALKTAGRDLKDLRKAGRVAGSIAAAAAQAAAPKRSGRMAQSLRVTGGATRVVLSSRHPGAAVIHWGWHRRHIRPNPWVTRGAQQSEPIWTRAYADHVRDIVESLNQ